MQTELTKPARRTRVSGRPGIYVHQDSRGRDRYEFCYRDSLGRLRWKTVEGGVTAAVAAREDMQARLRRGERVISSRMTLTELAAQWLTQRTNLRGSSLTWYELALRRHVVPRIGRYRVSEITVDDIARLVAELEHEGYAGSTITNILVPLGQIFDHAVRRGLISTNPVRGLERHERPTKARGEMRILDRSEIRRLLHHASPQYRTVLATAIFTGLRAGELLGLLWWHLDFDRGLIQVRDQIDRTGTRHPLKTDKGSRDVILQPSLASLLRQHRIASPHSLDNNHVFTRPDGRPMHPDVVRKYGLHRAIANAGLDAPGRPRLRFHDLRHTYASLMIAQGVDIAYVSRQLGHANITTTLNTYTHLFDHARNAETVKQRLEEQFGSLISPKPAVTALP